VGVVGGFAPFEKRPINRIVNKTAAAAAAQWSHQLLMQLITVFGHNGANGPALIGYIEHP